MNEMNVTIKIEEPKKVEARVVVELDAADGESESLFHALGLCPRP